MVERGSTGFTNDAFMHTHTLIADEPTSHHGADLGPAPFELLLSSLGACTNMTVRMYCTRKSLPLLRVKTMLSAESVATAEGTKLFKIHRQIELVGEELTVEQRARILEIAEMVRHLPVSNLRLTFTIQSSVRCIAF